MYNIYVAFECVPGKREEFVELVAKEGIWDAIRNEDGNHRYEYFFSADDETKLLLIEAWETKEHQQVHMTQPHMAKLKALKEGRITNTVIGEFMFV